MNKQILIRQAFNEQYSLLIEMDSMLINSVMKSKTEMRYDFTIKSISEDTFECRLVQLDIFIHETNNNLINEVAEVTGAFNRMFNELHLMMSYGGEVVEILNSELIHSKWKQTKALMQNATSKNAELEKLISLSDSLFTDPQKIIMAVQANEFIQVYFGDVFNTEIPGVKHEQNRTNLFNTVNLPWKISLDSNTEVSADNSLIEVTSSSIPAVQLDAGFKKSAYKTFEDQLDVVKLVPVLTEESKYLIDFSTGRVLEAEVIKKEVVEMKQLFTIMKYTLKGDRLKHRSEIAQFIDKDSVVNTDQSRFKFFTI